MAKDKKEGLHFESPMERELYEAVLFEFEKTVAAVVDDVRKYLVEEADE